MKLLVLFFLFSVATGQQIVVPTLDGRIVGGTSVNITDHPYQVSLQWFSAHTCGGAIISPIWILTAAHCVEGVPIASFISVRVASSYRNSGGQVYSVVTVISHPSYSGITFDYDVALLRLSSAISSAVAQIISLPSPGTGPTPNSTTVITGWGALFENGPSATILQMVQVPVISQEDCRAAYGANYITDRMFCAGLLGVGGKDACQGDSGGPVTINGTLYGLVSWGDGCARANAPGVYTNLPALRAWIAMNSGV